MGSFGVFTDITYLKQAEEQIRSSLQEKEVLLQEIHHRVKNNMQIIVSMLRLQFDQIKDPQVKRLLKESQHRIRSMAMIHESLYGSDNFSRIDFAQYLEKMVSRLLRSYSIKEDLIKCEVIADEIYLEISRAIPCGLIVNELVSNALKHAFPGGAGGTIQVRMSSDEQGRISITVSDDGVGFQREEEPQEPDTMGMRLLEGLIQQLQGSIEWTSNGGTSITVRFEGLNQPGSSPDPDRR